VDSPEPGTGPGAIQDLITFVEEGKPALRGYDGNAALARMEARYPELIAALEAAIAAGHTDDAMRLVSALDTFWMATQRLAEGSGWLERVLAMPGGDERLRGSTAFQAGLLVFWTGDDAGARAWHEQALAIGRRLADATVIAQAMTGIARIELRSDLAEARRLCLEAYAVTEGTTDTIGRGNAMHVLAVVAQMSGDLEEARDLMTERIRFAREAGNVATVGLESGNLSMVERQLGNLDRAEELARDALTVYDRREDQWAIPLGITGIAANAVLRGDTDRPARLIGAAEALMEAQGMEWPPDEVEHYRRAVDALRATMGGEAYEQDRNAGRSLTSRQAIDLALRPEA
jgi:tetratricopeptide (TPR) repeat protein